MAIYRVWFKSGSAMLVNEKSHELACVKATYQARANERANGTKQDSADWKKYTLVVKTENISQTGNAAGDRLQEQDSASVKWAASQVSDLIRKRVIDQEKFEAQLVDG